MVGMVRIIVRLLLNKLSEITTTSRWLCYLDDSGTMVHLSGFSKDILMK